LRGWSILESSVKVRIFAILPCFFQFLLADRAFVAQHAFAMNPIFAFADSQSRRRLLSLRQQAQTDKAPRVALRIQAILMSVDGHTPPRIASLLRVHRTRVHAWVQNWNRFGDEGLKEGHRCGRPCALSAKQQEQLLDTIESGPVAYGLSTGIWTSPLLAEVVEEEFGVRYHPGHVRKLLHRLGCSVQRPTSKLVQADPKEQNKWVRYTYPNLKKTPLGKGR
jgi:transposase